MSNKVSESNQVAASAIASVLNTPTILSDVVLRSAASPTRSAASSGNGGRDAEYRVDEGDAVDYPGLPVLHLRDDDFASLPNEVVGLANGAGSRIIEMAVTASPQQFPDMGEFYVPPLLAPLSDDSDSELVDAPRRKRSKLSLRHEEARSVSQPKRNSLLSLKKIHSGEETDDGGFISSLLRTPPRNMDLQTWWTGSRTSLNRDVEATPSTSCVQRGNVNAGHNDNDDSELKKILMKPKRVQKKTSQKKKIVKRQRRSSASTIVKTAVASAVGSAASSHQQHQQPDAAVPAQRRGLGSSKKQLRMQNTIVIESDSSEDDQPVFSQPQANNAVTAFFQVFDEVRRRREEAAINIIDGEQQLLAAQERVRLAELALQTAQAEVQQITRSNKEERDIAEKCDKKIARIRRQMGM